MTVPKRGGQQPAQGAEHGAVEPRHSPAWVGAAQHGELVPQCQDLDVLRGAGAGEQRQSAQQANEHQVRESQGHGERGRDGVLGTQRLHTSSWGHRVIATISARCDAFRPDS